MTQVVEDVVHPFQALVRGRRALVEHGASLWICVHVVATVKRNHWHFNLLNHSRLLERERCEINLRRDAHSRAFDTRRPRQRVVLHLLLSKRKLYILHRFRQRNGWNHHGKNRRKRQKNLIQRLGGDAIQTQRRRQRDESVRCVWVIYRRPSRHVSPQARTNHEHRSSNREFCLQLAHKEREIIHHVLNAFKVATLSARVV